MAPVGFRICSHSLFISLLKYVLHRWVFVTSFHFFFLNSRLNPVGLNMTSDIYLSSKRPRGTTYFIKYFSVLPKYIFFSLSISSKHILIIRTSRVAVLIGGTICISNITQNQTWSIKIQTHVLNRCSYWEIPFQFESVEREVLFFADELL